MLRNKCDESNIVGWSGAYSHSRGSMQTDIQDELLTSQEVAKERAIAELVLGAYSERRVSITTLYDSELRQNDIITFKNTKWIVKEIIISYTPPELLMTVKGLRYE